MTSTLGLLALVALLLYLIFSSSPPPRMRRNTPLEDAFLDAVSAGDEAAVREGLEEGVDPDTRYDIERQDELGDDAGRPALHLAIRGGHDSIARLLMEKGARLGLRDATGATALMHASSRIDVELVSLLLSHGASPWLHDDEGLNSLDRVRRAFDEAPPEDEEGYRRFTAVCALIEGVPRPHGGEEESSVDQAT